jgi:hypothetical protein
MPGDAHYRLIVAAPREKGLWSGSLKNESRIYRALRAHLGVSSSGAAHTAMEVCLSFLLSGRPYVLPLLFDENEAKSFAAELTTAGCDVQVVPFGE